MLNPFICGTFHHQEEDDDPWNATSPASTPRKSRRNSFCKHGSKDSKNPYSTRGLDKFSSLLAELDEKRQKIYSQMDSRDITLVRFVYKSSDDCVPIVVKLKDKKEEKSKPAHHDSHESPASPKTTTTTTQEARISDKYPIETTSTEVNKQLPRTRKMRFSWRSIDFHKWRRPSYYLPAVVILILLFLVFFGRSVAILCTCLVWYIVPTIKKWDHDSNARKSKKKKNYVGKFSENRMVTNGLPSPRSSRAGAVSHRKSF